MASAGPRETFVNRDLASRLFQDLMAKYGNEAAIQNVFVGSEACMACHKEKRTFRSSLHATGLKMALTDAFSLQVKDGVITDVDKNGVDDFRQGLNFNQISSVFNKYKPNAPILGFTAGKGYTITVGRVEYQVGFVHGGSGSYKQRFVLRFPVTDRPGGLSADYYYSPVQFNETSKSYVEYSPTYWYNTDNTPKINSPLTAKDAARLGKSFNKDCVGCHSTVFSIAQDANGEWVSKTGTPVYVRPDDPHYLELTTAGQPELYNIGCERCHGPGSRHIINLGDPKKIVHPGRDFTEMQQNELCGSCHSRGTSVDGKHEYPLSADNEDFARHLGEPLYGKFWLDKPGLWPDNKTSRQHHQQLQDMMKSAKWEFQFHKVTCVECHDVHSAGRKHIRTQMTVDGAAGAKVKVNVKVENNTLCLACHAGFEPFQNLSREDIANYQTNLDRISSATTAHTRHPYDPEGAVGLSRCTECHMARMAASGDAYDIASHTFEVVAPEKTLLYQDKGGMPNSCAVRCHRPLASVIGLPADPTLTNWAEPSDRSLADWLKTYFGPDGIWWNTTK